MNKGRCKCWFGPFMPKGYGNGNPYARLECFAIDGLGTIHCRCLVKCDRCGGEFAPVNIHLHPPDRRSTDQLLTNIRKQEERLPYLTEFDPDASAPR